MNLRKRDGQPDIIAPLIYSISAAHTVVIKGVKVFQNNASKEYSDLDVMQMIGRAVSSQIACTHLNTQLHRPLGTSAIR